MYILLNSGSQSRAPLESDIDHQLQFAVPTRLILGLGAQ